LGERLNGIQEVVGSTPIGSTNKINDLNIVQILSDRHFPEIVRVLSVFFHHPASLSTSTVAVLG
jgi:hypothetical protein